MSDNDGKPPSEEALPPAPSERRRPWAPPRITSGQLFEINSLACLKNDQFTCDTAGGDVKS